MRHQLSASLFLAAALPLSSCQLVGGRKGPVSVPAAAPADVAALLDQVKALEGEWVTTDEKGQAIVASIFKVSSGGSAVREIMFPGTGHEMTNMYHMDGSDLVVTHYCAAGNQPTMRARRGAEKSVIECVLDRVTDWRGDQQPYMGGLTMRILEKDHLTQDWTSFEAGKAPQVTHFDLRRKT